MSRLFKRKDSPYYYYTNGDGPKRVVKSTETESLKIARLIKNKWDEEFILQKHGITRPKILLYDLFDQHLTVIQSVKSASWSKRMRLSMNILKAHFNNIYVHDLKLSDVSLFIAERAKTKSASTIRHDIIFLQKALEYAKDNDFIERNIAQKVSLPKAVKRQHPPFSDETLKLILDSANEIDKIYWQVLLYTGLRAGDAGTIEENDIRGNVIRKTMQKTGKVVAVPLHPKLKIIKKQIVMVMPTDEDRRLSYRRLKRILKNIGTQGNLHTFRHTFSTKLFELGLSTQDVKIVTGHSTATMTAGYTHPRLQYIKEIFEKL